MTYLVETLSLLETTLKGHEDRVGTSESAVLKSRTLGTEACRIGCSPSSIAVLSASVSRQLSGTVLPVLARMGAELDTICNFKHVLGVTRVK